MENIPSLITELTQANIAANIAVVLLVAYCIYKFKLMEFRQASLDQKMDDKFKNVDDSFKNVDDKFTELSIQIKEIFQEIKELRVDMIMEIKGLKNENTELRKELKNDISELRKELKNDISELRAEMTKGFDLVANDIHAVRVDITRISERQDSMHARVLLLEGARS
ncbi:MAG: hypothetical protein QM538_07515 [Methylacidiphilales bacterium]|nr:hypothetical protein [Candidatus Methylacidiphilales bacterium]